MTKEETRVKLIKTEKWAEHIGQADLVIGALGYETSNVPLLDAHNRTVKLKRRGPHQQFEVDKQCRLVCEGGRVLDRAFGLGVGFPQLTKDLGNSL